jgi:hypothetical protein
MSYDFIVQNNMTVFKALNNEYDLNYDKPSWFTSSKEIGSFEQYYNHIYQVSLQPKTKLINITSILFHADLMNKILLNVNDPIQRDSLLLPLGIPDIEYQKETIRKLKELYEKIPGSETIVNFLNSALTNLPIINTIKLFGNHHRFSIENIDSNLVNFIKQMYPEYDGIISPVNWPSCFHNNDFPMELCIFNPKKICTLQRKIKGGKKKKGGSKNEKNVENPNRFRFGLYNGNKFGYENTYFDERILPVNDFKDLVLYPADLFSRE